MPVPYPLWKMSEYWAYNVVGKAAGRSARAPPGVFEVIERVHAVFISYRWVDPDQKWVREQLAPALRRAGLSVLLDVDDFVPGRDLILEKIGRASCRERV